MKKILKSLSLIRIALLGIPLVAISQCVEMQTAISAEYLIKLNNNKSFHATNDILSFLSDVNKSNSKRLIKKIDEKILHVELDTQDLKTLEAVYSDQIKYLEPNYTYRIPRTESPLSLSFPIPKEQWGLDTAKKNGVEAAKAWEIEKGDPRVIVAVIDTGIDYLHQYLKNNMWHSEEIPNNQIDDDGNGYIDDVYGYDFANNDADPMDDHAHGSHCAGVIAANGEEAMGLAPNVSLMALKFLDRNGSGDLDAAVQSIKYAIKMKANVLSNSWGGGPFSDILNETIQEAIQAGIIVVAASGNEYNNNDSYPSYPASYPNVVAVNASTAQGGKAYFSNYGKESTSIFAPGANILSTVPGDSVQAMSGTSMATPFVAAAAALYVSKFPSASPADFLKKLEESATPSKQLEKLCRSGGLLNAYELLK